MKSLASKVKSLASKPQVLENWPVLGSRTALFFEWLKFCKWAEKFFLDRFLWRSPEKIFLKTFFWRTLAFVSLALASSIPVLGLESVYSRKGYPWPWRRIFFVSLDLVSSLVSSTPPLVLTLYLLHCYNVFSCAIALISCVTN